MARIEPNFEQLMMEQMGVNRPSLMDNFMDMLSMVAMGGMGSVIPKIAKASKAKRGIPRILQRIEEEGVGRAKIKKEHGIYTSPANIKSPHSDLGGKRFLWKRNPKARVLDVSHHEGSEFVLRRMASPTATASPGLGAVKELLGAKKFTQLKGMRKSQLVEEAKRITGKDFSNRYDTQEVMEALGGEMARKRGYDALWAEDNLFPAFDEFVGLTKKAMKEID